MFSTTQQQNQDTINSYFDHGVIAICGEIQPNGELLMWCQRSEDFLWEEEEEANTTAELDAYLDSQLALQAELTKMTPAEEYELDDNELARHLESYYMGDWNSI